MTTEPSAMLAKAVAAWGEDLPLWVRVLAEECDRTTARAAAARIGYSAGLVSNVLANKYGGDMQAVELKVRGALMSATVGCPLLGDLATDICLDHQRSPWSARNPQSALLYRACRSGCPHSRIANHGYGGQSHG